jgi:hypothetical protein
MLTPAEEAIVIAFRQKTLLRLDDGLGCLNDASPISAAALCVAASLLGEGAVRIHPAWLGV